MTDAIPIYGLYGEAGATAARDGAVEFLHCESIPVRSRLHDWRIRPHRHDGLFQLLYARSGAIRMTLDGAVFAVSTPCLVTIPSVAVHGFAFTTDVDGWVVTLAEAYLERMMAPAPDLLPHLAAAHVVESHCGASFQPLDHAFQGIAAEFAGIAPGRSQALQALLALVFVWLARARQPAADAEPGAPSRAAERIRQFRSHIQEHHHRHLSVADYADRLRVTPTQLNRICRSILGVSALQVIHDHVILEAKRNLVYTSMTVAEIAYALGYGDPAYFTRFFTKRVGRSPVQFREAARKTLARGGDGL